MGITATTPRRKAIQPADILAAVRTLRLPERIVPRVGALGGLHASVTDGRGLEFKHQRPYVPGDDIRHIDWPLFARTRRLFTRLRHSEHSPRLAVFMDGSASMASPSEEGKFLPALELALAMAFIGVASGCIVDFLSFPAALPSSARGGWCSFADVMRGAEHLAAYAPEGFNDLDLLAERAQAACRNHALTVVISDFLVDVVDPPLGGAGTAMRRRLEASVGGVARALEPFSHSAAHGVLVRCSGDAEDQLPEATLVRDVEGDDDRIVAGTPVARKLYRQAFDTHGDLLGDVARGLGFGYVEFLGNLKPDVAQRAQETINAMVSAGGRR